MTVKELREVLTQYDDDQIVLVNTSDGMQDWLSEIDDANGREVRQMTKHPRLQGEYVEREMADAGERMAPNNGVKCGPAVTAVVLS